MDTSTPEHAYRVPFRLERLPPTYTLLNIGAEQLHGVTFTLHGNGLMSANAPAVLRPSEALQVVVSGHDLPRNAILVVRWFRPNGVEYLWRVSF
jgi:hypothetical protein